MRYRDVTVSGAHNINQPYAELVGYICARCSIPPSYTLFGGYFFPFNIKCWLKSVSDSGFLEYNKLCRVRVKWRGTNINDSAIEREQEAERWRV